MRGVLYGTLEVEARRAHPRGTWNGVAQHTLEQGCTASYGLSSATSTPACGKRVKSSLDAFFAG